jgi:hypothetical protein
VLLPGPAAGEPVPLTHDLGHQVPHHGSVVSQCGHLGSADVAAGVASTQHRRPLPDRAPRADQPRPVLRARQFAGYSS